MKSSKSKMPKGPFKALISDVDGTLMLNQRHAMPSNAVRDAIKKAEKKIKFGIATSRPLENVNHIIEFLTLTSPCIIAGGPQVYDPTQNKIVWQKSMDEKSVSKLFQISRKLKVKAFINDGGADKLFDNNYRYKDPIHLWIGHLPVDKANVYYQEATKIPTISVHKIPSWTRGEIDLVISHAAATKQHGILEVAKILGISTHEIIGVGDGYNDFPLLMACGLKVAMGNAVDDLKEIADYVAPPVEEDGIVDVINRFVL